ncbi:putative quinol monooxygenase [Rothia sp. P6271]|uniref:putative quinol monooxygenase n=1 Tax=unclassified Rothia (in: high G+C Gram-positive bacteria) TaxID=2689056 RepID=UPI003AD7C52E
MIGVYAQAIIKTTHAQEFEKIAQHLVDKAQEEQGMVSYNFGSLATEEQPAEHREYAFIERWESIEDLETHMDTEHFKKADQQCQRLLASPMQITIYELPTAS